MSLRRVVLGLLLAVLTLSLWGDARAEELPNVVLIIADDMGYGDYSFLGHPQIRTPGLDKLAKESLVFPRGHVPSSLCSPSLATILTGLFPSQHGITSNDPPPLQGDRTSPQAKELRRTRRQKLIDKIDAVPTLPKLLAEKGYVSFQSGKWWLGPYSKGGFTEGMTHGDPERGGRHGDAGLDIGRKTMKPVLDFIDRAADEKKPFFVWYAPMLPHSPHNPPEFFLKLYRESAPSPEIAKYWAMCTWFDSTCDQLLDHLDQKGIGDNTLVVYVCDNGWIQDPQADKFAPRSKKTPYEGGLRTPIMIRWRGKITPGTSEEFVSSIDLAPTIQAACGLKKLPNQKGLDLRDETSRKARKSITGEIFEHDAVDLDDPLSSLQYRWIISEDWKLIVPNPKRIPGASQELYNLKEDPTETRNLAEENTPQLDLLKKQLKGGD